LAVKPAAEQLHAKNGNEAGEKTGGWTAHEKRNAVKSRTPRLYKGETNEKGGKGAAEVSARRRKKRSRYLKGKKRSAKGKKRRGTVLKLVREREQPQKGSSPKRGGKKKKTKKQGERPMSRGGKAYKKKKKDPGRKRGRNLKGRRAKGATLQKKKKKNTHPGRKKGSRIERERGKKKMKDNPASGR